MSEPAQPSDDQPADAADLPLVQEVNAEPDDMLALLVGAVNGAGGAISLSITIQTGGSLITGQLVAGRAWFEGVAESLRASVQPGDASEPVVQAFAEMYTHRADTYPRNLGDREEGEEDDSPYTRLGYLHLKDAVTLMPGGMRANLGWWRVRLPSISGWCQGGSEF